MDAQPNSLAFFARLILLLASATTTSAVEWTIGRHCPTVINAEVPSQNHYGEPRPKPTFGSMSSIHKTMLGCSTVTSFSVRVRLLGCSGWPDRWNFPFDLSGADKYPSAPEELSLDGYSLGSREWDRVQPPEDKWEWADWVASGRAWKYWRWRHLPAEQRSKTNLDLWLDAMDFSHVRSLSLNWRSRRDSLDGISQQLPRRLSSLRSLSIASPSALEFILALPASSLDAFAWVGNYDMSPFEKVLKHHGASLSNFSWHAGETLYELSPEPSVAQLRLLGTYAPNLRSLTIDLGRHGSWPWDHLEALATGLPALTDLTIYFDMASVCKHHTNDGDFQPQDPCEKECRGISQFEQPLVNKTTGLEVVRFLQKHKVGKALQHVELRSGDWSEPWDGPIRSISWLDGRQAWVACTLHGDSAESDGVSCDGQDTRVPNDRNRLCETSSCQSENSVAKGWESSPLQIPIAERP